MKTLTVRQPFAQLICMGVKDVENRTWKTNYRGTMLIHAAKEIDTKYCTTNQAQEPDKLYVEGSELLRRSVIIGCVDLVDIVTDSTSPWAISSENDKQVYHWVLANPRLFDYMITNVSGRLSLWDFDDQILSRYQRYFTNQK